MPSSRFRFARRLLLALMPLVFAPSLALRAQTAAFGRDDSGRLTDQMVYVWLADGSGTALERLRRKPATARTARLGENLFTRIGRPHDQPADAGELFLAALREADGAVRSALLVESSTGYVAYFPQLGKGSVLGAIRTTVGRPFGPLADDDGNFALLLRRDDHGRTVEAVLYHATRGQAIVLRQLDTLPSQPQTAPLAGLPVLRGPVTATAIDGPGGATRGYLLFDQASGEIHAIAIGPDGNVRGDRLRGEGLYTVFPAETEQPASPRFLVAPISDEDGALRHVLIADAGSGQLAWLVNAGARRGTPRLRAIDLDLDRFLATASAARVRGLAWVPRRAGDGATTGAWLIDAATRRVLLLDGLDPASPSALRVEPVELQR